MESLTASTREDSKSEEEKEDEFYKKLEETNTLFEYFGTCGIKHSKIGDFICKTLSQIEEGYGYEETLLTKEAFLNEQYEPEVTSRFPLRDKKDLPFPDDLFRFCFPIGYEIEERHRSPEYFSFVLTDSNGLRTFISVVKIFEELEAYQRSFSLREKMKNVDERSRFFTGELFEKSSFVEKNANFFAETGKTLKKQNIPKGRPSTESNILERSHTMEVSGKAKKKKQKGATKEVGVKSTSAGLGRRSPLKTSSTVDKEPGGRSGYGVRSRSKMYFPTCLCLISKYPFFKTFQHMLYKLQRAYFNFLNYPIEYYISYLTTQVPVPPRGFFRVIFELFNEDNVIKIHQPPCNKLPLADLDFKYFFRRISLDNLFKIMNSLMLEKSVVLLSPHIGELTPICETLRTLIFPFELISVYIPLLPNSMLDVLYSPVPFIMGVHSSVKEEALYRLAEDTCVVDLEQSTVMFVPRSESSFDMSATLTVKLKLTSDSPPLPPHVKNKLKKRLDKPFSLAKKHEKQWQKGQKGQNDDQYSKLALEVRTHFLWFFVSVFKKYKGYIDFSQRSDPNYEKYFNIEGFCSENPEAYRPFLRQFLETQMFQLFIDNKMNSQSSEKALQLLFFDESIDEKLGRYAFISAIPTPFLKDTKTFANFERRQIKIPAMTPPSMEELIESYLASDNLISIGRCRSGNVKDKKASRGFRYHLSPEFNPTLFPKLDSSLIAENLIESAELTFKSTQYLPSISKKTAKSNISNEECIFIMWIGIWCATLWNQDESEKMFRLEQMFDVLFLMNKKGFRPTVEVFQLIMQASSQHGNPLMVVKVYEKMSHYKFKPNAGVYSLLFKAIAKNKQKIESAHDRFNACQPCGGSTPSNRFYGMMSQHQRYATPTGRNTEFKIEAQFDSIIVKEEEKSPHRNTQPDSKLPNQQSYVFRNDTSSLDVDSKYYEQRTRPFRERTFLFPEESHVYAEQVAFSFKQECPNCNTILDLNDIKKEFREINDALCTFCKKEIIPHMRFRIGKEYFYDAKNPAYIDDETLFLNPAQLRRNIESLVFEKTSTMKVDLSRFRENYKVIFWNLIWHIAEARLPFDLILPYKDKTLYDHLIPPIPPVIMLRSEKDIRNESLKNKRERVEFEFKFQQYMDAYRKHYLKDIAIQVETSELELDQKSVKKDEANQVSPLRTESGRNSMTNQTKDVDEEEKKETEIKKQLSIIKEEETSEVQEDGEKENKLKKIESMKEDMLETTEENETKNTEDNGEEEENKIEREKDEEAEKSEKKENEIERKEIGRETEKGDEINTEKKEEEKRSGEEESGIKEETGWINKDENEGIKKIEEKEEEKNNIQIDKAKEEENEGGTDMKEEEGEHKETIQEPETNQVQKEEFKQTLQFEQQKPIQQNQQDLEQSKPSSDSIQQQPDILSPTPTPSSIPQTHSPK